MTVSGSKLLVIIFALHISCKSDKSNEVRTETDEFNESIQLPDGFRIGVFAEGSNLIRPRLMALGDKGTVFVGTYFYTSGVTSPVYAIVDDDQDGKANQIIPISNNFNTPNGVDFHNGTLYISDEDRVFKIDNVEDNLLNPTIELIYDQLPAGSRWIRGC